MRRSCCVSCRATLDCSLASTFVSPTQHHPAYEAPSPSLPSHPHRRATCSPTRHSHSRAHSHYNRRRSHHRGGPRSRAVRVPQWSTPPTACSRLVGVHTPRHRSSARGCQTTPSSLLALYGSPMLSFTTALTPHAHAPSPSRGGATTAALAATSSVIHAHPSGCPCPPSAMGALRSASALHAVPLPQWSPWRDIVPPLPPLPPWSGVAR